MKEVVLITGANGNLAKHLTTMLEGVFQIKLLSRNPKLSNEYLWDIEKQYIDPNGLQDVDHIIHLSGASIAAKRWSIKRKREIVSSRIDSAKLLLRELISHGQNINTFISASAVGYYRASINDCVLDEKSPPGVSFLSEVCCEWEKTALSFESLGIAYKTAILRFGIILDPNSGALKSMALPIKYGAGSGLGSGDQWVPWIHIYDLSAMLKYVLLNNLTGVFNAVSPAHTTNDQLTKAIAIKLNRKLILPNIPVFLCKIMFGEMADVFLTGEKVSSDKIQKRGFRFTYTDIDQTIDNLL